MLNSSFNRDQFSSQVNVAASQSDEVGVVLQLADGSIQSCNAIAERLLGLTIGQIQGRTSLDHPWQAIHADGSEFPSESYPATVAL